MPYFDIMSPLHKSTKRDYLARVNNPRMPKFRAAEIAKRWGFEYWDGSRDINYGGYYYKPGYWKPVAEKLIERYSLSEHSSILDIGCGKGFLLYEIMRLLPGIGIQGLDISGYAVENSKEEVSDCLVIGSSDDLPFKDKSFDLAFSINTFHNLTNRGLQQSLCEISRVSRSQYICVESYRNEEEKMNLLYWQVTCEQFNSEDDWQWWFESSNYSGDFSFIFFE